MPSLSLSLYLSKGLHLLLPNGKFACGCQKKLCFHTSEKKRIMPEGLWGVWVSLFIFGYWNFTKTFF